MVSDEPRAAWRVTVLLLIAVALVGLAHVAFLPPWEGFDETAHWSYIQQWSDTGHAPRYGVDGVSKDVDAYRGPMPYSGATPFDRTGHATFRSYRRAGVQPIKGGPTRYASDGSPNWQAQHPPLYYALLAPLYRLTRGLGWIDHLFVLRLASFALAYAGFVIGVLATAKLARRRETDPETDGDTWFPTVWIGPIMAAWPFLFPQFFPEFARLGNDSLCLLLMGGVWALLLRLLKGEGRWISAAALGALLGLGLLTKAFFLPISAGIALILMLWWWTTGRRRDRLAQVLLAGSVAIAIGGWWYVQKAAQTGTITGADEFIKLKQAGGMAAIADGFSASEFIRGLWLMITTFVWAGTWSLASLPDWTLVAPLALLALLAFGYAGSLRRGGLLAWTPLILATPMAVGLIYHVFVWMAGTSAFTPGWYFHILAAPLGLAVARGWRHPRILAVFTGLTGLYAIVVWAFQISMFSGCAAKLGADEHYAFQGGACFIDPYALSAVGQPLLGGASLVAGAALAVIAGIMALRAFRAAASGMVAGAALDAATNDAG